MNQHRPLDDLTAHVRLERFEDRLNPFGSFLLDRVAIGNDRSVAPLLGVVR